MVIEPMPNAAEAARAARPATTPVAGDRAANLERLHVRSLPLKRVRMDRAGAFHELWRQDVKNQSGEGALARTTRGPSRTRPRRSRRSPRARRAVRAGASRASSREDDQDDRELHGLDPEVEDEQRRQQRPREGLVDPERAGEPEPVHQAEAEDHREPRATPRRRGRGARCAAVSSSVACDRRCQIRHRCRPATTAIESAMTGSTSDGGHVHEAERGQDEGHRVGERERRRRQRRSRAGGATRRSAPAGTGCGRSRCRGARPRGGRTPSTARAGDCCVENAGCFASRLALPDLQVEVVRDDRLGAAHVALGVREQLAAHLVRVAGSPGTGSRAPGTRTARRRAARS